MLIESKGTEERRQWHAIDLNIENLDSVAGRFGGEMWDIGDR